VLVVDDEDAVRAVARRILTSAGYVVLEASDGVEALKVLKDYSGGIDLLLTDVVMPRMGGQELAERMNDVQRDIRVLFMSGYLEDGLLANRGEVSDSLPLSKPFTAEDLLPRVRTVLDE
jgi:CheY-like chemotaxis protein